MSNFSESLTIRILGDSSHLDRELERVTRRITQAAGDLSRVGDLGPTLERGIERLSGFERPLLGVTRALDRVMAGAQSLSRMPITLNVGPAIGSLSALGAMIDFLAAKLRMLSSIPVGFGRGGSRAPLEPIRQFAGGGLVTGAAGRDRVPALLTAGEFVLKRPVVERLGTSLLHELNRLGPASRERTPSALPAMSGGATTVNHFGGIEIHVAEPGGVNDVVRDLRLQGFRLRNRRG